MRKLTQPGLDGVVVHPLALTEEAIINTLYKRNFHTPWRFLRDGSRSVRKL